jgi:hypothetical protein
LRRRLDPLELEKLARKNEELSRTPFDLMVDIARALVSALVVSTVALTLIAYALSELPGPTP